MSESTISMPATEFCKISQAALDKVAPDENSYKKRFSAWSAKLYRVQMYLIKREERKFNGQYPFFGFDMFLRSEFYPSRPREPYGYSKLGQIRSLLSGAKISENAMVTFPPEIGNIIRHWAGQEVEG